MLCECTWSSSSQRWWGEKCARSEKAGAKDDKDAKAGIKVQRVGRLV